LHSSPPYNYTLSLHDALPIYTVKLKPLLSINCFTAAAGSSCRSQVLINKNATSGSSLYLSTAICIAGKDLIQGAHQVAQKSSTTTFPFRSSKETSLPSRSFRLKPGAGLGLMVSDFFETPSFVASYLANLLS